MPAPSPPAAFSSSVNVPGVRLLTARPSPLDGRSDLNGRTHGLGVYRRSRPLLDPLEAERRTREGDPNPVLTLASGEIVGLFVPKAAEWTHRIEEAFVRLGRPAPGVPTARDRSLPSVRGERPAPASETTSEPWAPRPVRRPLPTPPEAVAPGPLRLSLERPDGLRLVPSLEGSLERRSLVGGSGPLAASPNLNG